MVHSPDIVNGYIIKIIAVLIIFSTIASANPFVLEIYGNANMDNTINERDLAYVSGVIHGHLFETWYADANYDGRIDERDLKQIQKIISGTAKEIIIDDKNHHIKRLNCYHIKIPNHIKKNHCPFQYWGRKW
nr:dockerin type I repeat-containing protein [uncultured Methanospirillum sp.]